MLNNNELEDFKMQFV